MSDSFQPPINIEFELRFNWRKAVALGAAIMSLIVAIKLLNSDGISILGVCAAVMAVRLMMGSPIERSITNASLTELTDLLHDCAKTRPEDETPSNGEHH